ncbi:MAG: hypothetical protein JW734_01615 [Candidatus Omnitrophica bacterium]|nr:hypothetical protein [Candidatus Omnitrophota bacterium]
MRYLFCIVFSVVTLSFSDFSFADEAKANVATKLASGFGQMATSILEVPNQGIETSKDKGPALGVASGMTKGFLLGAMEFGEGLVNVVTSAVPPYETRKDILKGNMLCSWDQKNESYSMDNLFSSAPQTYVSTPVKEMSPAQYSKSRSYSGSLPSRYSSRKKEGPFDWFMALDKKFRENLW